LYGWHGRILHVDLTERKIWNESFDEQFGMKFLGARGINAKLLFDLAQKPGIDPFDPDNPLIFGVGPLAGTNAPTSGRSTVTFISPATNMYGKSNVGGHWGGELKYAGYDNIVIHGASKGPVYVWIRNEDAKLVDASHVWGKTVLETDAIIKKELQDDDIRVACIGPAGENRVRFASIMNSVYNAMARGGAGAVMGSKNLKAIAVRGTRDVKIAHPDKFRDVTLQLIKNLAADSGAKSLHEYGTAGFVEGINEIHAFPALNFKTGHSENVAPISGPYLVKEGYLKRRVACFGCSIGCHRYSKVNDDGPYRGKESGGPEYETFGALGAGCGIYSTGAVIAADDLCNTLGMDTISAGGTVQWAMESYERGVLTKMDTDGLDLNFGNDAALIKVLEDIAYRRTKLGNKLAEGAHRASRAVGKDSWKWAITNSKGLEQSRVETRAAKGYALAFAVNPRGPDHLHTEVIAEFGTTPEAVSLIERITGDKSMASSYKTECRAEIVRWHEDIYAATDALGLCAFSTTLAYALNEFNIAEMFSALTGTETSAEQLMDAGRRIVTLERLFNTREGADRRLDDLPYRLMNEPVPSGPPRGFMNSREELDKMLDRYYELHNWDVKTGVPKKDVLKTLDLEQEGREVEKWVKLP
jgi:aldehyde:ferredoxin oxidoreductase